MARRCTKRIKLDCCAQRWMRTSAYFQVCPSMLQRSTATPMTSGEVQSFSGFDELGLPLLPFKGKSYTMCMITVHQYMDLVSNFEGVKKGHIGRGCFLVLGPGRASLYLTINASLIPLNE